jgi:replicative DNA helicase
MSETNLFNQDSELAVLSILLSNPDKIDDIQNLRSFMFTSTPNQVLFDVIQELNTQNLVPETNLLINYLGSKDRLDAVGGVSYLNYLKDRTYNAENLKEFERLVIETYKAKSIINLSAKLPGMLTGNNPVDQVISYARETIDNLTLSSGGEKTMSFIDVLREGWDEIVRRVKNPGITGTATGLKDLDLSTGGISHGKLWIVASRPSMGKSSILCNIALNTAKTDNGVLLFSYEMSKQDVIERFLGIETGVGISDIHLGILDQKKLDIVKDKIAEFKHLPIYIDTNFTGDLNYVISTIRRYHKTKGIKVVCLDYIQLMAERDANATNALGQISRALKLLANELGIAVIVASQLHRGVELRDDKRPVLSDLRQSGNLEEDADVVAFLYRDEYYNSDTKYKGLLEFIIRKNRQNGVIGTALFGFDPITNRIVDKG